MKATNKYGDKEVMARCVCSSNDHMVKLSMCKYDYDGTDTGIDIDLTFSMHLSHGGFWHRLKKGLKYIFSSNPSRYGCWDEMLMSKEDAEQMKEVIDEFLVARRQYNG